MIKLKGGVIHSELSEFFTTISLKLAFDNAIKSGKIIFDLNLHEKIHGIGNSQFSSKETGGFGYKRFKFLLNVLNIDERKYSLREHWFKTLSEFRNNVAHGGLENQDIDAVKDIHETLNKYLNQFSDDINDYAQKNKYLKTVG